MITSLEKVSARHVYIFLFPCPKQFPWIEVRNRPISMGTKIICKQTLLISLFALYKLAWNCAWTVTKTHSIEWGKLFASNASYKPCGRLARWTLCMNTVKLSRLIPAENLSSLERILNSASWFQRIQCKGKVSDWLPLRCGVPQGSLLGPLF